MKLDIKSEEALSEIQKLLMSADLVPVGLERENLYLFYQSNDGGQIIGVVGLEVYPEGALLRSLAVRADARSTGIARALLNEASAYARSIQSFDLFLLTETVAELMHRYGFRDIQRENVPTALLASPFFNGICPCSCHLMHKNIQE